ncbi:rac guanine nucleotide exchange factor JJ-like isoform X2 [Schistocerca piceifrons]|uniref:rac guanine nucleotide exchange factor JJ-like isoform X2 n=1 Tax=Schistocerca piceifrons TaxID=274613 RepID=UPI001F5EAFF8|nr:rac guanine nucleotide exchange factor JJ-like isoform X2 [Schistocerca piceifrons]
MMDFSVHFTPQNQLTLSAELRNVIQERNILTTRTRLKVLSDLDGVKRTSDEEKRISLRNKAIQEILTSEVSYLRSLETVMKYFMEPLQDADFISPTLYNALFGHIQMLYKVNGELLNELKMNPDCIAEAFLRLAPFFKLYSVYAYDYKQVLSIMQDIGKKNGKLNSFIKDQESRPEVGTKLPSLLITPIQRVPRYRLLLQEVLSYTPKSHKDYAALVSPQGKSAHPRYFILFNDMLMYCKIKRPNTSESNSLKCCCVLPLKKCTVAEILSKGMFKITCHGVTILVYTVTMQEGELWISAISEALKQYHENRQTLRKDSSSRRPMRRFDILREMNHNSSERVTRKRKRCEKNNGCITQDEENRDPCETTANVSSNMTKSANEEIRPAKTAKTCETLTDEKQVNHTSGDETKDCLYPLRESMKRGRNMVHFREEDVIGRRTLNEFPHSVVDSSNRNEITWTTFSETVQNTISENLSEANEEPWHIRSISLIRNFIAGFRYCFRKHVLKRHLRVPDFNQ